MRISLLLLFVVLISFSAIPTATAANKLDISTGYYSLTGKTATSSGTFSGLGVYRLGYRRSVSPRLDLGVGYNLNYSALISGDAAYGWDIGVTYFPFTLSGSTTYAVGGQQLEIQPDLRPFVGAFFTQRNIQSVQTTYAGFGLTLGVEKTWSSKMSISGALRYTTMSGTRNATATIMDFLIGLSWGF